MTDKSLNINRQHPPAIEVNCIHYNWGKQDTLNEVSFKLHDREMLGLLGPNGAGKTTLICLIAGLIAAKKGDLNIYGETMQPGQSKLRKQLGFVFQSVSLDPFLTVQQNLEYAAGLQGLSKARTTDRLAFLDEQLKIAPLFSQVTGTLSGGQKRLIDIARALLHNPNILILDEPTTALDPSTKQNLWNILKRLKTDFGKSILVATHLMDEAQDCDKVAFLNNGKIHWEGTPEQALNEMPDQRLTEMRRVNLADWFVWKLAQIES